MPVQKPSTDTLGSTAKCTHWIQRTNVVNPFSLVTTHDGMLDQQVGMQVL